VTLPLDLSRENVVSAERAEVSSNDDVVEAAERASLAGRQCHDADDATAVSCR